LLIQREIIANTSYGRKSSQVKYSRKTMVRNTFIDFRESEVLKNLLKDVSVRRNNVVIVGPSGIGKSSFVHSITYKIGVHFVGTVDELKQVLSKLPFLVFDDFDWTKITAEDCKRLFDRESMSQTVHSRYRNASLSNSTCRIVLCNEVPDCLKDPAVKARYILYPLEESLINEANLEAGLRKRTSHLEEGEIADDDEYLDEDDSEGLAVFAFSSSLTRNQKASETAIRQTIRRNHETVVSLCDGTDENILNLRERAAAGFK